MNCGSIYMWNHLILPKYINSHCWCTGSQMCKVSDLSPWTFCSNEHAQLFIFGWYTWDNSYKLKDNGIAIPSISGYAGKIVSLLRNKEDEGYRNRAKDEGWRNISTVLKFAVFWLHNSAQKQYHKFLRLSLWVIYMDILRKY